METTMDDARSLLVNFTRECLAGEVPAEVADDDDFYAVAAALARDSYFFAHAVVHWPTSRRRALFEMLAAAISQLRTRVPELFERNAFDGCIATAVAAGFGRWLATLQACVQDAKRERRLRAAEERGRTAFAR